MTKLLKVVMLLFTLLLPMSSLYKTQKKIWWYVSMQAQCYIYRNQDPAVNGTKNVLNSCKKHSVKQVVLTSSVAAITDSPINDKVYTEEDWNTESNLGRNPYYYSKTLAEKAAWKFVEDLPEEEKMKLVVINVGRMYRTMNFHS